MSRTINVETVRRRQQELTKLVADEHERADVKAREVEQHKQKAAEYGARLDEITSLLISNSETAGSENVIPLHRPVAATPFRPSLRYRNPGATTDIVSMAYSTPGIETDNLTDEVFKRHRHEGTTRETISKILRRMIREGYAYREGAKFYLTEICRSTWEASPLYRAS